MADPFTPEQAALLSCYTGKLLCPLSEFYRKAGELMGRPVFSHEIPMIARDLERLAWDQLQNLLPREGDL